MRRAVLYLAAAALCTALLATGAQTITGYHSDPNSYGFHHLQSGYFIISVAVILLGWLVMLQLMKRLEKRLF